MVDVGKPGYAGRPAPGFGGGGGGAEHPIDGAEGVFQGGVANIAFLDRHLRHGLCDGGLGNGHTPFQDMSAEGVGGMLITR